MKSSTREKHEVTSKPVTTRHGFAGEMGKHETYREACDDILAALRRKG